MSDRMPESWVSPRPPSGALCYHIVLWCPGAVSEASINARGEERTALLQKMQEAGTRGARGALSTAQHRLKELNAAICREAFAPMGTSSRARGVRADLLRTHLRGDASVLGYRLGAVAVEVWLELSESTGIEARVRSWQEASGAMQTEDFIAEQIPASEILLLQREAREAGTENAAPVYEANASNYHHTTVLLQEAVEALQPSEGKLFVDATLGGGGHSERLLAAGATVWGIDRDPAAREAARKRLAKYGNRLHVLAGNSRDVAKLLHRQGVHTVDGILADLGVSSHQVDTPERGFSFMKEGPLDMRMDPSQSRCAADIVNDADEQTLAEILRMYGEERASRSIAKRIVQQRALGRISTTTQLADVICSVLPRKGRLHPATRSFQALRIAVNDEVGALSDLLEGGLSLLHRGGRMVIISFHSLEDRTVKHFFERVTKPQLDRPEWSQPRPNPEFCAVSLSRKPVTPSQEEVAANPRARSAKMRVIEKL